MIYGLSLASIVVYINLYLMQGMLPMLSERFMLGGGESSLVLSVTSFSLAFSLLGFALASDAIGRFRPMMLALWLLALSNPLMLLIESWHGFLGLRLIQGVLLAAVPAIAMAFLRERLPLAALIKAAAFYIAANSFGGIVGRLLGGAMAQHLDWQGSVLALSLLTLLAVAVCHLLLRPAADSGRHRVRETKPWRGFALHLGRAELRLLYLLGGLAFMVMVNQFSFIQLHLLKTPFEWSRFEVTLIFLCYLSGTLSAYRSAAVVARLGVMGLFCASLLLMVAGSLLTLIDTAPAIIGGFLMTACGFFLIHACCNSQVALKATGHRAKASALYLCCYYLGAALGGPFLMPFWQQGGWGGVVAGSLLLLGVAALVMYRLGRRLAADSAPKPEITAQDEPSGAVLPLAEPGCKAC
nr:MFS transporter [Shewanella jiangmenensis]